MQGMNYQGNDYMSTSTNNKAALRSLMNLRISARYLFSFCCLLRNSIIQYRRLVLQSLLTTLACMLIIDAIPSSWPAEKGGDSPLRNALTCIFKHVTSWQRNITESITFVENRSQTSKSQQIATRPDSSQVCKLNNQAWCKSRTEYSIKLTSQG